MNMSKFLNKYVRKTHRWLALLFVVFMVTVLLAHDTQVGYVAQRAQQILLLIMALTGLYLFALPWWVRRRKRERQKQ